MGVLEPKKMALLRILQILEEDTDMEHHLTQEQIAAKLERDYGIEMERKAIGRNLALLDEAG
ncbi:MAG: WYL domain-containing protein, partial [Firmicutes bacterium]|nr:WYL domain-containing protein [Bacillota bacterium]